MIITLFNSFSNIYYAMWRYINWMSDKNEWAHNWTHMNWPFVMLILVVHIANVCSIFLFVAIRMRRLDFVEKKNRSYNTNHVHWSNNFVVHEHENNIKMCNDSIHKYLHWWNYRVAFNFIGHILLLFIHRHFSGLFCKLWL